MVYFKSYSWLVRVLESFDIYYLDSSFHPISYISTKFFYELVTIAGAHCTTWIWVCPPKWGKWERVRARHAVLELPMGVCPCIYYLPKDIMIKTNRWIEAVGKLHAEPKRDLFCIQIIITTSLVAFWNFPLRPLHTPLGLLGRSSPELRFLTRSLPPS